MFDTEYYLMFEQEQSHWWFVSRRGFISAALRGYDTNSRSQKRIIDIGSGTGGNISLLRSFGSVIGIEPHPTARRLARLKGIHLRKGTAQKTGIRSGSADMVCCFDVLYHQGVNDKSALKEAYRLLKPGGILCITDSALPWLGGPHDIAMQARERYMLSGLVKKVKTTGFSVLKTSYLFFALLPIIAMKRFFNRIFRSQSSRSDVAPVPMALNTLCIGINIIETIGLSHISYPWGSSLLILAQKPLRSS